MPRSKKAFVSRRWIERLRNADLRAPFLLGIPPMCLLAYSLGGERLLAGVAISLPLLGHLIGRVSQAQTMNGSNANAAPGFRQNALLRDALERWQEDLQERGKKTAHFILRMERFDALANRHGEAAAEQIQRTMAERIARELRDQDVLARTAQDEFQFLLNPVRNLDLEICIQLATRLKAAVQVAIPLDGTSVQVPTSIAFCRSDQIAKPSQEGFQKASRIALQEALRNGPSAIRAYSEKLREREKGRRLNNELAAAALENREIEAWFQPQVSTETGDITGFEALARWNHPQKGVVGPGEFLEVFSETGQLEQLAEHMLNAALEAQKEWEANGFYVPHVGVNFAGDELRNPLLVDKIHWELDRYNLTPDRVAIEVLETVIAGAPDSTVSRNVNGLAGLGCYIDLDDFGTGHASISSIRRFSVSRLKIDRSFVMNVDTDPEQQRLVSAIVTMAERLGLETLAEGVETAGEHAMLAQLGCAHVQGFGIARPMAFDKTIPWLRDHMANCKAPPKIGRKTG